MPKRGDDSRLYSYIYIRDSKNQMYVFKTSTFFVIIGNLPSIEGKSKLFHEIFPLAPSGEDPPKIYISLPMTSTKTIGAGNFKDGFPRLLARVSWHAKLKIEPQRNQDASSIFDMRKTLMQINLFRYISDTQEESQQSFKKLSPTKYVHNWDRLNWAKIRQK